jgi:hypothetical protein
MNRSSGDFTSLVEERTFMESIISRYRTGIFDAIKVLA